MTAASGAVLAQRRRELWRLGRIPACFQDAALENGGVTLAVLERRIEAYIRRFAFVHR